MPTDTELLDFLQRDIQEQGAILLHDGYANCGMNRGLACVPGGLLNRSLREAIAAMMPKPAAPSDTSTDTEAKSQPKE